MGSSNEIIRFVFVDIHVCVFVFAFVVFLRSLIHDRSIFILLHIIIELFFFVCRRLLVLLPSLTFLSLFCFSHIIFIFNILFLAIIRIVIFIIFVLFWKLHFNSLLLCCLAENLRRISLVTGIFEGTVFLILGSICILDFVISHIIIVGSILRLDHIQFSLPEFACISWIFHWVWNITRAVLRLFVVFFVYLRITISSTIVSIHFCLIAI
mmetsp:Transcript_12939/g.32643  ORF Transcript_12939/g.32643 Transcript_12939/m.32643 type:complete len:210 (-) Transcript_12939:1051-1680(-)